MKFSIITPSYNQAQYLPTCLRSVGLQTHRDLEHIVVDGGSKDGSQDVLRDFQTGDSRLRFTSGPDKGQGDAVNKGFAAATGDIIAWINSDDYYYSPTVFETVARFFAEHPGIDFVYGGMVWVDGHNRPLTVRLPPRFDWPRLFSIAYIGNTNAFFRRAVIDKHHIDIDLHYVLDHEFVLRATRDFRTAPLAELLACFRVHPVAKTQTMTEVVKNQERRRRDAALGFEHKPSVLKLNWWRLHYRLERYRAELRFLPQLRRLPPYQVFLDQS